MSVAQVLRARHAVEGGAQLFLEYAQSAAELLHNYGFVSSVGDVAWEFADGGQRGGGRGRFLVRDVTGVTGTGGGIECESGCEPLAFERDAAAMRATVLARLTAAERIESALAAQPSSVTGVWAAEPDRLAEVRTARAYLQAFDAALGMAIAWAKSTRMARTELR